MNLNDAILKAKNAAHANKYTLRVVFPKEVASVRPITRDDFLVSDAGQLVRINNALCSVVYTTYSGREVWPDEKEVYVAWPNVAYFLMLEPL